MGLKCPPYGGGSRRRFDNDVGPAKGNAILPFLCEEVGEELRQFLGLIQMHKTLAPQKTNKYIFRLKCL